MNNLNIGLILLALLSLSCKSSLKDKNAQEKHALKSINFELGDSLISNISFIKTIDKSCRRPSGILSDSKKEREEFNQKCNFYKINYEYDFFRGLEEKKELFNNNYIDYYLALANKKSDSDDYKFVNLYSTKNNQKQDSLIVFSYENYIEALVNKSTYFYIKNNDIYIYEFNEDEEGIHSNNWKEYRIEKGKFKLLKNTSF
ncbi:hypothetical protein [Tenacibaculum maritimum]|uniref:hypothetical protein n=2 Tax=Tenacibaculum maritimum TaxID=107401 RepID=UPI0012E5B297|nr:hypothetical protein [Tenacibaculum maritimum]CAA0223572.1 conserved hypothetical protein [Tenacibaculum maritimum]CAA0251574.1 conserved hypothetical protein [Tenacibaculum maritimum]